MIRLNNNLDMVKRRTTSLRNAIGLRVRLLTESMHSGLNTPGNVVPSLYHWQCVI